MIRNLLRIRKSAKTGLPPGSMVYIGQNPQAKTSYEIIEYDQNKIDSFCFSNIDDFNIDNPKNANWLNIYGVSDVEAIKKVGQLYSLSPLILEDIVNTDKPAEVDIIDDHLCFGLNMLDFDSNTFLVSKEKVNLILKDDWLLCFQERHGDIFDPIRNRLNQNKGRIRSQKSDYLFYCLLDNLVDHYYNTLEKIEDCLTEVENEKTEIKTEYLEKLNQIKSAFLFISKELRNLNEVILSLTKTSQSFFSNDIQSYFKDTLDHAKQIKEEMIFFSERLNQQIDNFHAEINLKLTQSMNLLTIIGTIFIPLTFLTSIYGMNFKWMPELEFKYGYPTLMTTMLCLGFFLFLFFRKRF